MHTGQTILLFSRACCHFRARTYLGAFGSKHVKALDIAASTACVHALSRPKPTDKEKLSVVRNGFTYGLRVALATSQEYTQQFGEAVCDIIMGAARQRSLYAFFPRSSAQLPDDIGWPESDDDVAVLDEFCAVAVGRQPPKIANRSNRGHHCGIVIQWPELLITCVIEVGEEPALWWPSSALDDEVLLEWPDL